MCVPDGELSRHKTFHSYTVRAKQGGGQSSRDNKSGGGSHPKSAGASLRRYNEAAFAEVPSLFCSTWPPFLLTVVFSSSTSNSTSRERSSRGAPSWTSASCCSTERPAPTRRSCSAARTRRWNAPTAASAPSPSPPGAPPSRRSSASASVWPPSKSSVKIQ